MWGALTPSRLPLLFLALALLLPSPTSAGSPGPRPASLTGCRPWRRAGGHRARSSGLGGGNGVWKARVGSGPPLGPARALSSGLGLSPVWGDVTSHAPLEALGFAALLSRDLWPLAPCHPVATQRPALQTSPCAYRPALEARGAPERPPGHMRSLGKQELVVTSPMWGLSPGLALSPSASPGWPAPLGRTPMLTTKNPCARWQGRWQRHQILSCLHTWYILDPHLPSAAALIQDSPQPDFTAQEPVFQTSPLCALLRGGFGWEETLRRLKTSRVADLVSSLSRAKV